MALYPSPFSQRVDADRGGMIETADGFVVIFPPGLLAAGTTSVITIYGPASLPDGISVGGTAKRNASLAWVVKSSQGVASAGTGPDVRIPYEPANKENSSALVVGYHTTLLGLSWLRASNDTSDDPDPAVIRRMARITIPNTSSFSRCVAVFGD